MFFRYGRESLMVLCCLFSYGIFGVFVILLFVEGYVKVVGVVF